MEGNFISEIVKSKIEKNKLSQNSRDRPVSSCCIIISISYVPKLNFRSNQSEWYYFQFNFYFLFSYPITVRFIERIPLLLPVTQPFHIRHSIFRSLFFVHAWKGKWKATMMIIATRCNNPLVAIIGRHYVFSLNSAGWQHQPHRDQPSTTILPR